MLKASLCHRSMFIFCGMGKYFGGNSGICMLLFHTKTCISKQQGQIKLHCIQISYYITVIINWILNSMCDMGENRIKQLTLNLTQEQIDTIAALFAHNEWELDIQGQVNEAEPEENNFIIHQNDDALECPMCLCKPCITSERNRQEWWETQNNPACEENSSSRKEHYRRFWVMLLHRKVWDDERYKARKAALQAHAENVIGPSVRSTRREIMPDCILKCVRSWLPNPENTPYMGHKWM